MSANGPEIKKRVRLSKVMSLALRHAPEKFGLVLDPEGYVPITELVAGLNKAGILCTQEDIEAVVESCDKKRFQIENGDIRACYGHSLETKIKFPEVVPPSVLYHSTARRSLNLILGEGLKPMGRQYVHLTTDPQIAAMVGRRRDPEPAILKIDAQGASAEGVRFYCANERFYLADFIPAGFISH
ncbi:MAG: RNA 2'-phosphotransferase [Thermoplasmata archaeon]